MFGLCEYSNTLQHYLSRKNLLASVDFISEEGNYSVRSRSVALPIEQSVC